MDEAERLYRRMLKLWGVGQLGVIDDTGVQQTAQVQIGLGGPAALAEVQDDVPRLGEYGLAYCPPDGSEAIVLYLGGQRSMGVIVATGHRASRPTGLKPGEAMLYNGLANTWVKMAQDGSIQSKGTWQHTGSFSATGDIEDHAGDGKGATMESMRQTFDTHDHPAGSPNTGVPNQQLPD